MRRLPIHSSVIVSMGYDLQHQILEIQFKTTGTYQYHEVPIYVFKGLQQASSKGHFFDKHVRDHYPYIKID